MNRKNFKNSISTFMNNVKRNFSLKIFSSKFKTGYANLVKKETDKYGKFNSYDLYKNIALFAMVVDHLGYFFFYKFHLLRLVGRTTVVILSVLFGLSYRENKKPRNRIFIFAVITTLFQLLLLGRTEALPVNILYSFYFSFFLLGYLKKLYDDCYPLFLVLISIMIPACFIFNFFIEYGVGVVFLMFCGTIFAKEKKSRKDTITTAMIFAVFMVYQILNFQFKLPYFIILSVIYSVLYVKLFNFKIKPVNKKVDSIFMLISRRSLEFYFLHLVVFMLIFISVYGYFR